MTAIEVLHEVDERSWELEEPEDVQEEIVCERREGSREVEEYRSRALVLETRL